MEQKNSKNPKPDNKDPKAACADGKVVLAKKDYELLNAKAQERDSLYDRFLRAQAESENIRKRLEKEKMDFVRFANENLILEFLPILDNLQIAERHIKEAKDFDAVRGGVDMIHGQIQKFMSELGVERIKAVGEKFDPNLHEAVETEESAEKEDSLVVAELKAGYKLNGRLLRPASVRIVRRTV